MSWNQPPSYPPPMPSSQPGWTRMRVIVPSAIGLFFLGVIVGSAGSSDTTEISGTAKPTVAATAKPTPTATATTDAAVEPAPAATKAPTTKPTPTKPTVAPADAKPANPETAKVPNFVGMVLQTAQDTAQAEGFFFLASHDSLGASRMQVLDRNWKVCSQNVAPGKTVSVDTKLDFGTVKLDESCP